MELNKDLNVQGSSAAQEEAQGGLREELRDILVFEAGQAADGSFFFQYKDRTEIAQNIASLFFGKKFRRQRGFYNTDLTRTQIGILTNCLGLQTAASLAQLDLDISSYNMQISETLCTVLASLRVSEDVYEKLKTTTAAENPDLLNFNMSPYISDSWEDASDEESDSDELYTTRSCVESASNVLKALCQLREALFAHLENVKEGKAAKKMEFLFRTKPLTNETKNIISDVKTVSTEEMIDILEKVIKYTVGWLCEACIPARTSLVYEINGKLVYSEAKKNQIKYLGWNFFRNPKTNNEAYDPSLYMTYSVCSAYMEIAGAVREARSQVAKLAGGNIQRNISAEVETLAKEALTESFKRDLLFYRDIHDEFELFRDQCIYSGRYEEMQVKRASIDLASKFIGQNFTSVDYDDIENSTTNDALINTVFHVLILLYSGIDLDYEEAARKGIVASGEFYDEMQYALQNVLRRWKSLNKSDKGYIVEQYTLSFKENMPGMFLYMAKQLRRQRIQVASLLPILIRAYNEVSRYLIRYPQKQNIEYLALVLQNRSERDGVQEWAWDREGYNLNSEMYYVKAIVDFYDYYRTFEEPFLAADKYIQRTRKEYETLKSEEIKTLQQQQERSLAALNAQLAEKDKRIEELERAEAPLVKEVKKVVQNELTVQFEAKMKELLQNLLSEPDAEGSLRYLFNALTLDAAFNYRMAGSGNMLFDASDYNAYDNLKSGIENFARSQVSSFINREDKR